MRKITAIFLILFCFANLFAYEGMLAGQKDLKVIKTEFFDIIYTPDSEKSAAVIAEHADDLYRELSDTYKVVYDFRTTVTITSSQDMFNAYFTFFPYNHIVLFDTQSPASMAVFDEDLVMTFRHELTHAITMNIKNPFWNVVSKIFGTGVNPSILFPTGGQLEGIAITEESRYGEGRLNSEFTRHIVKQSKIEDKFPHYSEITGARTIYVYDYHYKFGGEFMDYVRRTYGEEKLAKYWRKLSNFGGLTYFTIFKTVYGISMNDAWNDFKENLPVPNIPADPTETGIVSPFTSDKDYELYNQITSSKDKLVYYNNYTTGLYYVSKDGTSHSKPKKFLQQSNVVSMNLSQDGRYLTYVYQSGAGALPKNKMVIYDFETKSKFSVPEERLNNGVVFTVTEGSTTTKYLVANKNISQNSSLEIFRLEENSKGRLKDIDLVETINNRYNNFATNLQSDNNGTIYYLSKEGVSYIIKSYDFITKVHKQYDLPHENMLIQGLSLSTAADGSTRALFSYVLPGTMPRLGEAKFHAEGLEYNLYQQDLSGGIFTPVALNENEIVYVGQFFEGNTLLTANILAMESVSQPGVVTNFGERSEAENEAITFVDTSILNDATDFSVWPYIFRGTWLPISSTASYGLSQNFDSIKSFSSIIGATFIGTLPWSSPIYTLSVGYNTTVNSGTFQTDISGGTATPLFNYRINNNLEVDGKGYKQTYHNINLSSGIPVTSTVSLKISDTLDLFEGRQTYNVKKTQEELDKEKGTIEGLVKEKTLVDSQNIFFTRNVASLGVEYVPIMGKGYYEAILLSSNVFLDTIYAADINKFEAPLTYYNNIGLGLQVHVPQLIPVAARTWGTWNLPLTVSADLYPSQSYFLKTSGNLVLFSFEIQKAIHWFPIIFFNTVTAEMEYVSKFSNGTNGSWAIGNMPSHFESLGAGKMTYSDELTTRLSLTLAPNIGSLANIHPALNFDFKYRFFPEPDQSHFAFAFLLALDM